MTYWEENSVVAIKNSIKRDFKINIFFFVFLSYHLEKDKALQY